ncbi:MAG: hypothetical protein GYB31_05670 [Bacteroidetes bacterium]|nr:hypothetical protein [Bacteroidota bacterium]
MSLAEQYAKEHEPDFLKKLQEEDPQLFDGITIYDLLILENFITKSESLNLFLRHNHMDESYDEDYMKALFEVSDKLPRFQQNDLLFRGSQIPSQIIETLKGNGIYKDNGFLSTAVEDFKAKRFCYMTDNNPFRKRGEWPEVFFIINGSCSGIELSKYSDFGVIDGYEIFFLPNTQFKISSIEDKIDVRTNMVRGKEQGTIECPYIEITMEEIC